MKEQEPEDDYAVDEGPKTACPLVTSEGASPVSDSIWNVHPPRPTANKSVVCYAAVIATQVDCQI